MRADAAAALGAASLVDGAPGAAGRASDGGSDASVVWITGASSGIGRATAHACARRGDHLVLSSRAAGVLAEVEVECAALGAASVMLAPLDVSDSAAVDAAAGAAVARHGRLDLVVSNAGVAAYSRVEESDDATFERVLEVNVGGAFRVARASLRIMRAQERGSLVVVGSVLGRVAVPLMGAYVASKWALRGFVRVLRAENRDLPGVTISLVAPGGVSTPVYDQSANAVGRRPKPPFPVARPERVAAAVLRAPSSRRWEIGVGWANPAMVAVSELLPGVWDRIAPLGMSLGGLSRTPVGAGEPAASGNLWAPRPELERLRRDRGARPDQVRADQRPARTLDGGTLEP